MGFRRGSDVARARMGSELFCQARWKEEIRQRRAVLEASSLFQEISQKKADRRMKGASIIHRAPGQAPLGSGCKSQGETGVDHSRKYTQDI